MNTKTFKTGDIVTPEFLNELQNPSFNKQPGEVGHLPLPPNYSEKQQCKTIHVAGATNTVDLRGWHYNAVIIVTPIIANGAAAFPQDLILQTDGMTGAIFVIPELNNDELYIKKGPNNTDRICSLRKGEIAIIFTRQVNDDVRMEWRRIPGGSKCFFEEGHFDKVVTDNLTFGNLVECISAEFDGNCLVFSILNEENEVSIKFEMPLTAPGIGCGTRNQTAFAGMAATQSQANIAVLSPPGTGGNGFTYSTESGIANILEIPHDAPLKELLSSFSGGKGMFQQTDAGNAVSGVYFNRDVNDNGEIITSMGQICIYNKPTDTEISGGTLPTKCIITSESINFYTHGGSGWFSVV